MSTRQRFIAWGWIATFLAIGILPPWVMRSGYPSGYHLILLDPPPPAIRVDLLRLSLEWVLATVVAAGLYFVWPFRPTVAKEPGIPAVPPPLPEADELQPGRVFLAAGGLYIVSRIDDERFVHFYGITEADESFCHVSEFDALVERSPKIRDLPHPSTHGELGAKGASTMDGPDRRMALKALRADRLGYCLMGLILGGCVIGVGLWGLWNDEGPHKLWIMLVGLGIAFGWAGIGTWRNKSLEILELKHAEEKTTPDRSI